MMDEDQVRFYMIFTRKLGRNLRVLNRSMADSDLYFKMITFGFYMENRLREQGRSRETSKKFGGLGQGDSTEKWCIDY